MNWRTDHVVDAPLTFDYLQSITAPQKSFVWFEDSGHYPPFEEPQKFNAWMIERVLPIARSACASSVASTQQSTPLANERQIVESAPGLRL